MIEFPDPIVIISHAWNRIARCLIIRMALRWQPDRSHAVSRGGAELCMAQSTVSHLPPGHAELACRYCSRTTITPYSEPGGIALQAMTTKDRDV